MSVFTIVLVLAFLAYLYYIDKKHKCEHTNKAARTSFIKNWEHDGKPNLLKAGPLWDYQKPKSVVCDKCGEKFWFNP